VRGSRDSKEPMLTSMQFADVMKKYRAYKAKNSGMKVADIKMPTRAKEIASAIKMFREESVVKGRMMSKGKVIPPTKITPNYSSSSSKSNK